MVQGGQTLNGHDRQRFAAFISYAHADAAIAGKLQSRLERYRLPKHIAAAHADGQAALGQIFRDREDLAAAPSLSDAIRAAIGEAEALIVICSPEAKASRWVSEEIALFRSLHPDRPILAALARGEPDESFPAALTEGGNEPLAADLRKQGDGEALGFLKIVAGIAGVPLDTLVQRDAQRRIRRVMWITGAALAAMLVMGVMTSLALSARNEAARQRAEAEGLVEYMLTDLREKLKGVGRLDVMGAVNNRAKEYYGGGSIKGQLLNAQILHAMGEDSEKQGKLAIADSHFAHAYRITKNMLTQHPNDADAIFAHGQSEYWLGYSAWRKADRAVTLRHWQRYHALAMQLAKVQPNNFRSALEQGYAVGNLCDLYARDDFDLNTAQRFCDQAISHIQNAVVIEPSNQIALSELANRLGWKAGLMRRLNRFGAEYALRAQERKTMEQLIRLDPKNLDFQLRRIWPDQGLGISLVKQRKFVDAVPLLFSALSKAEKLSLLMPDDTSVLEIRAKSAVWLAQAQAAIGSQQATRTLHLAETYLDAFKASSDAAERSFAPLVKQLEQLKGEWGNG